MLWHWLHQAALTRTAAVEDRTAATGLGGGERSTVSNEQRPPGGSSHGNHPRGRLSLAVER